MQVSLSWLNRKPTRWTHLQRVPLSQLLLLLTGVFLLFSVIGFYVDVIGGGTLPYITTVAIAIVSGLNAVLWVWTLARLPTFSILFLIAFQFYIGHLNDLIGRFIQQTLHPAPVSPEDGLHFAGTAILVLIMVAYSFFSRYMGATAKEAFRLENELALAHSIQKTLVPALHTTSHSFEIYGISEPSEKVGGDLVDVVQLRGGDTVAYLADIAGHGLQAGILMGMLKTAARTALTNEGDILPGEDGSATLSMLMERINLVLPQVKEAHMYATFTALRLNADGQSFYGMAASPPLMHWSAARQQMLRIEEQQFPLGLIPVSGFPASPLSMEAGDVVLIATDGILEVNAGQSNPQKSENPEYGIEALEALLKANLTMPLPELGATILKAVRSYGKQVDDQTLLLVRRSAQPEPTPGKLLL